MDELNDELMKCFEVPRSDNEFNTYLAKTPEFNMEQKRKIKEKYNKNRRSGMSAEEAFTDVLNDVHS